MTHKKQRILNVDDNAVQRYTTSKILLSAGYEVVEASTGRNALSLANGVDVIVLDVDLPDLDGFEVTRRLRSANSAVPIIQISSVFSSYSHVSDGLKNGANAYFALPLQSDKFLHTLRELMNRRSATSESPAAS